MSEMTIRTGDAQRAWPGSTMTVGARRIAMGVVAIRRVPPFSDPPRGGRWARGGAS